jgi:hypothetical protein
MKKLLIVLAFGFFSCSSSDDSTPQPETCYNIIARGTTPNGDFIIIKYSNYVQKKYAVTNFLDYLNKTQLCEPITLTQIPL